MDWLIQNHKMHWSKKDFSLSVLSGFLLLIISLVINYEAGMYATNNAGPAVTDIILDNIPVFDVDWLFLDGALAFLIILIGVATYHPKYIPFILKSSALFVVIRSISISLTHIGPAQLQSPIILNSINKFFIFGGDLFFSGHTGVPFLMALIFWKYKILRGFFIFASLMGGVTVLLGHFHYSIDVFAAFFITYGIFHMAQIFFKKDYEYALAD